MTNLRCLGTVHYRGHNGFKFVWIWESGKKVFDGSVLQKRQKQVCYPSEDSVIDLSPLCPCLWLSQKTVHSPNMMPTAKGMSHMIPNHVLRVGQTIRLDSAQANQQPSLTDPSSNHGDPDLDISLDNLNQLILELDPTFEPIPVNKSPSCISPPTGTVQQKIHSCCKAAFH